MKNFFDQILNVNTRDPEDFRRRRLLNIMLLGMFVILILNILSLLAYPQTMKDASAPLLLIGLGIFFVGILAIYFINRYSGRWAAFLFLLLLTLAVNLIDTPDQLASGRSTFVYTIPIAISSLILFPSASFIFTTISAVCIYGLATYFVDPARIPNWLAIVGFYMLALVSWLTTRSLEQALKDLREINTNLDKLVEQKTQELATTLSREIVLAGRNQAILDSIADGVIVFDASQVSILVNPALSRIIETPVEGLMGISLAEFLKTRDLSPSSQGTIMGMIEHPEKIETGIQVEWGKKTLAVSVARVRNSETDLSIGAVAVIRDVTHEAEIEKMKNTFVAVVSHELRTPLNAIMGYAEMLKEAVYGTINEKQASITIRIMVNTQRLLSMVGDLLDEAQIKAGKLSLTKQPFKTSSLLDSMHSTMDKITADKGLYLTDELDPDMPEIITGDARRLQQVLINLVNNSAKFTEKGGIHARILRSVPDRWTIEVMDTGLGIPKEEIPYIFDTFRQVENSTIRKHGGFGLGLAIVKQLVELMKGEIAVNSELGKGSTFIITLPLESNP
jgi:PAS domain S-box-containing protein